MIIKGRFIQKNSAGVPVTNGMFSFSLGTSSITSAGIFKTDGTLVKTLWNNKQYASGTHTEYWDALDDYGNTILSPEPNYEIKVVSNNVTYEWQGTVGNTSDNMTGGTKHRGYYHCMRGLAFGPTYGYFCTGYSEGSPSIAKFNISTPNQKIEILNPDTNMSDVNYVATDGTRVYWGAYDANVSANSYVFGTLVSNDAYITFSSGITYTPVSRSAINVIGYSNTAYLTGLAVQQTGNYLFITRAAANQLIVLNKLTGALVQTLTYTNPKNICIDSSDNLIMITGTSVNRYTVNGDGTLTSSTLSLSGLINPLSVTMNGSSIVVTDGGTSQQIKFFNSTTGALSKTLGTLNGYNTSAVVADNKFYFSDINNTTIGNNGKLPFITFQSDGSYWVNDSGNYRVQHYNSSDVFINRIMSLGSTYNVFPDKNNINRLFVNYLEFDIDYSVQTLTGSTGWTLTKNWGALVDGSLYDGFGTIRYQTTLSNGRTYGTIRKGSQLEVVEFTASNTLRFTNQFIGLGEIICQNGDRQVYSESAGIGTLNKYTLTGFDGSNNLVWSGSPTLLASGTLDAITGNPITFPLMQAFNTTNKVVFFSPGTFITGLTPTTGYHLGAIESGTSNILFQTEKSTHRNYSGPYPNLGWFDVGNIVNVNSGGVVNIADRNIITSYHGENWKNVQTNYFNHYLDNGLGIGQFGTDRDIVGLGNHAAAEMAGNALTPVIVKDGSDLYLYHGDESDHAGAHRWKITNLSTIIEQTASILYPSTYTPPAVTYADLMTGLPWDSGLVNNTSGWTRNPTTDNLTDAFTNYWKVSTSKQSYDILKDNDVSANAVIPSANTYTVSRDLGTNNVATNWKILANISYPNTGVNINNAVTQQFLEVLDINNKVLTTMHVIGSYLAPTFIYANGLVLATASNNIIEKEIQKLLSYEITIVAGVVTFTYGNYTPVVTTISDPTGDWTKPKTIRMRFVHTGTGGTGYGKELTIQNLKFYKDY